MNGSLAYSTDVKIVACDVSHFEKVKALIDELQLDNRSLKQEEFLIALHGEEILGFGRIREYESCSELCSLGVVEPHRYQYVGTALCKALIKKAKKELYLVCIIPLYFHKLGFKEVQQFPAEIRAKINYCTGELPVPETYVAMKF